MKEQILGFGQLDNLSASTISIKIVERVILAGLDLKCCVGQGYDGASTLSGHTNGVQAEIRQQAQAAVYTHCVSHYLNLVLNHHPIQPSRYADKAKKEPCVGA